jgi:hypothetical protein
MADDWKLDPSTILAEYAQDVKDAIDDLVPNKEALGLTYKDIIKNWLAIMLVDKLNMSKANRKITITYIPYLLVEQKVKLKD